MSCGSNRQPSFSTEAWLDGVASEIGPRLAGRGLDFRIRLDSRLQDRRWVGSAAALGNRLTRLLDRSVRFIEGQGLRLELQWLGEDSGIVRLRIKVVASDADLEGETRENVYGPILEELGASLDRSLLDAHLVAFRMELQEEGAAQRMPVAGPGTTPTVP